MKNLVASTKNAVKKMALSVATFAVALTIATQHSYAANTDLDTVTGTLTTGAGDMKTNFLTLIAVIIPIIIVVFGIGWLIVLFKKKMSKAS